MKSYPGIDIYQTLSYLYVMDVLLQQKEFSEKEHQISKIGKLLSHPARVRVLNLLLEKKSMTSSEIASLIPLARTTVLQHINALKEGKWLNTTSDGSTIQYQINSSVFGSLGNDLELLFLNCSNSAAEQRTKSKILFICTGNSCRSQMAEGFINALGENLDIEAFSAGTKPAKEVQPLAVKVMAEKGIDISSQYPKEAKQFVGDRSIDLVIIVCDKAEKECPYLFPYSKHRIFMPFKDPKTPDEFRDVRDAIEIRMKNLLEEMQIDISGDA